MRIFNAKVDAGFNAMHHVLVHVALRYCMHCDNGSNCHGSGGQIGKGMLQYKPNPSPNIKYF